jgi:MATE family, multidrug efflux pump
MDNAPRVSGSGRPIRHRDVVAIALPIMLSNATTPLIGFADTVVVGRLGEAHLIGAVAVAANIFNFLYWSFGFLRMGTTGLTAQAVGAGDRSEAAANLYRALLIALGAGVLMIAVQGLIAFVAFTFMAASPAVEGAARTYFEIRIWAAPAGLINFALLGWFIGLGRAGRAFVLQLFLNSLNIALAVALVIGLKLGVTGVAAAALAAEWIAALVGLWVAWIEIKDRSARASRSQVLDVARLKRAFQINADIMIRTFCILGALFFFTAQSAQSGDFTLAANAVLQSIAMIAVYLLDGFAFAAEVLVGQSIGARVVAGFRQAIRVSTLWAALVGLALSAILWFVGPMVIDFMTTSPEVRTVARDYLVWAVLTPIVGVWCFQLDGIFIGATRTADMRNMMLLSLVAYLAAWAVLKPVFGNHGLWAALFVFYAARAVTLYARLPALERAAFAPAAGRGG